MSDNSTSKHRPVSMSDLDDRLEAAARHIDKLQNEVKALQISHEKLHLILVDTLEKLTQLTKG